MPYTLFCLWNLLFRSEIHFLFRITEFLFTLQDSGLDANSWSSQEELIAFFFSLFLKDISYVSVLKNFVNLNNSAVFISVFIQLKTLGGAVCVLMMNTKSRGGVSHSQKLTNESQLHFHAQWLVKTITTFIITIRILFHSL